MLAAWRFITVAPRRPILLRKNCVGSPLAKRAVIRVVVRRYCSDRRQPVEPERDLAYLIKLILDWGWVHATQHLVVAVVHMFVVVLFLSLFANSCLRLASKTPAQ